MGVKKTLVTLTLSLLLASEVAVGGAFNRGLEAYFSGDHQTALSEWEPLAKVGHAQAQYNLGLMYRRGQSVPHSDKMAVKWYTLAAQQGVVQAQFNLGFMYDYGHGVPENNSASVKWYTLAAVQSHAQAQSNLGVMYKLGEGIPQNYEIAVKWYTLAAHQGLAEAQLNLAHMLQFGRGVPIDYVRSYMWCSLSAYNGHKLSATYTADMAALMTYAELTKAQNMPSHCLRNNYIDC